MSVADVAAAAGVGRVTLYGHFKTRAELVDAALVLTLELTDRVLDATDTTGDPAEALTRLVASSGDAFRRELTICGQQDVAELVHDLSVHDRILRRVQTLIERGQRTGTFRKDLSKHWLITTAISLMHAAADDTGAGWVKADDAARLITATLLIAFTPPGATVTATHR